MRGVAHLSGAPFLFTQAGVGEEAREVVEAVAGGGLVPFQHAELEQFAERVLRRVRFGLPEGGGGPQVERVGEDGECAPEFLRFRGRAGRSSG